MKRSLSVIIILFCISFLSSESFAQFHMKLGPQIGMNFNIGTGSDLDQTPTGIGVVIGSQLDMSFTPIVGLLAQVQFYDDRGAGYTNTSNYQINGQIFQNATLDNTWSLSYFMIEPLVKLSLPTSNFYFLVGPSIGFNLSAELRQKLKDSQGNVIYNGKVSLKDLNVRFAFKAGAGYDFSLGGITTLTPQFSFGYGLTNVQSDVSSKIMTFQLAAIVKFGLM